MKYTVEDVEKIYEESCRIKLETLLNGDYKKGNREGKKLIKIYKMMEQNIEWGHRCIDQLICNDHIEVKAEMAGYCLAMGYRVDDAVSLLEKIASDSSNGILGFNAKMTLKVWREKGYLKLYQ